MEGTDAMVSKIPVVDLMPLAVSDEGGEGSDESWERVGRQVCQAFSDIGFVYLTNHGIPKDAVEAVNATSGEFFRLDDAQKLQYERGVVDIQGFTAIDREKLSANRDVRELRESYDVKKVDGLFPDEEVPDMRPRVATIVAACKTLTYKILTAMAVGLGLDREFFVSRHRGMCEDGNSTSLRLLYYPSLPAGVAEGTTRCGAHTDYGTITLLFQDDIGGLQVKDTTGEWVDAAPVEGAVLVNVGDILQFWTADKLRATEHRVLVPAEECRRNSPRRSVVFFVHPDDPEVIAPLDGSSTYCPITSKQHTDNRFRETYVY